MRRPVLAAVIAAMLVPLGACASDEESAPAPGDVTTTPVPGDVTTTPATTTSPTVPSLSAAPTNQTCDFLPEALVSAVLGRPVEAVPVGESRCTWGELSLVVAEATPAEFAQERAIRSVDAPMPPSLGIGAGSYLIVGQPGGTASAGTYVAGRKAVLTVPGALPPDTQRTVLSALLTKVAAQL